MHENTIDTKIPQIPILFIKALYKESNTLDELELGVFFLFFIGAFTEILLEIKLATPAEKRK